MRTILLTELPVIEVQATEKEWKYFVAIWDKMSFDYENWVFTQTYVPSNEMTKIQKEVKDRQNENDKWYAIKRWAILQEQDQEMKEKMNKQLEDIQLKDRQDIADRLNEQQKEREKTFSFAIMFWNEEYKPLNQVIDKLIEDTDPIYDISQ